MELEIMYLAAQYDARLFLLTAVKLSCIWTTDWALGKLPQLLIQNNYLWRLKRVALKKTEFIKQAEWSNKIQRVIL